MSPHFYAGGKMISKEIVRLENITKKFPGVTALSNVSISFNLGECHALVGENGAGKSTLIKTLLGAYQPTEGTIYYNGEEVSISNPAVASSLGIEGVHQELMLIPYLSVSQNIYMNREIKTKLGSFNRKEMDQKSKILLESFGVNIDVTKNVKEYSASIWKMIDIARVVNLNPKVIIFDEPSAILTEKEVNCLFDSIKKLKEMGMAIIYISHRLDEIGFVADKISILRDGHLIKTRDAKDLTKDDIVKAMVGRDVSSYYSRNINSPGEELLRLENVDLKKGQQNISLHVNRGEIVGLAGLVGAGRTEVAEGVMGINQVLKGNIYYKGKKYTPHSPSHAINEGIYLVPENRKYEGLILKFSVANNIALSVFDRWGKFFYNKKKEEEAANKQIKELSIKTPTIHQKISNLSGGNQQKVVIGKALETNSEFLIFDEPSVGVDVGAKEEIHNHMDEFVGKGGGILMISSDLPEVIGLCDRVYVMYENRIVKELSRNELSEQSIADYMLGSKTGDEL